MCFSAEADLVAGIAIGLVGLDAVRHVRQPAELPLALLPVVLAGHQLMEAFAWWGLQGTLPESVADVAVLLYLTIAFGVVPVLVPVAVGALEPTAHRPRVLALTALGTVAAMILMTAVLRGPVDATIAGHHIAYRVDLWQGGLVVFLYVVATCGSTLLSSHAHVRWFGTANLVAVVLLALLYQSAFISLWCAWAAVLSVGIAWHLRRADRAPAAAELVG